MGTISVSLPADGTTADVADVNTPITTIVNEFNGNIDNANIKSAAAIATSKLADDAGITTAKLTDSAVTPAKILAGTGTTHAYQSWTPTWAGTTIGNATVVAKYIQIGKTVQFHIVVTIGSTTTIAGVGVDTTFTLPVTAVTAGYTASVSPIGRATSLHSGTLQFGTVTYNSATIATLVAEKIVSSTNVASGWNSTAVGVSTSDTWGITGSYEVA